MLNHSVANQQVTTTRADAIGAPTVRQNATTVSALSPTSATHVDSDDSNSGAITIISTTATSVTTLPASTSNSIQALVTGKLSRDELTTREHVSQGSRARLNSGEEGTNSDVVIGHCNSASPPLNTSLSDDVTPCANPDGTHTPTLTKTEINTDVNKNKKKNKGIGGVKEMNDNKKKMKYILVTGGVVSGLGKGVTASSIGVTSIKIGPVGRVLEADLRAGDRGSCMCYTYSLSKGAFVGVSLEGNFVASRMDTNLCFYSNPYLRMNDILLGIVESPKPAEPLYSAMDDLYSRL